MKLVLCLGELLLKLRDLHGEALSLVPDVHRVALPAEFFGFAHSHLLLGGAALDVDQLGPNAMPVTGAKVYPGHGAIASRLNQRGQEWGAGTDSVPNVSQMARCGLAKSGEPVPLLLTQAADEGFQFHAAITSFGDIDVNINQ